MQHNYVQSLSKPHTGPLIYIINTDVDFNAAVQSYKTIVTHYLAAKMEIWFSLFMKHVHGVGSGVLSFEFAASRGVINYYSLLSTLNDEGSINIFKAL